MVATTDREVGTAGLEATRRWPLNAPELDQPLGTWTISSGPDAALQARDHITRLLARRTLSSSEDALLVVSELVANASEHGSSSHLELDAEVHGPTMRIRVRNASDWSPGRRPFEMPPPEASRGRGLAIVEKLAEELDVTHDAGSTVVSAVVSLDAAAS